MNDVIHASGLYFSYQSSSVLQGVDLSILKEEFVGIIGPNGGGKTTLLKLIMGFLKPHQGILRLFGLDPLKTRFKIGYVPQIHRLDRDFPITVWELILLGALSHIPALGKVPKEIAERARNLAEEFGLDKFLQKPFSSLSGGLAQRALFIRALLSNPELLLLDEPTANVDAESTQKILAKLDLLRGRKTILIVTHDLPTIIERVDRVLLVNGHVHALLPKQICEHFALGLYHTPLIDLPKNHFAKGLCRECSPV